jgi:hypothetical protein
MKRDAGCPAPGASEHRPRRMLLFTMLALLALPMLLGARPGIDSAPQGGAARPCMSNDPYSLEDLREILNDPAPSRVIRRINPYMTVRYTGRGELIEEGPRVPIVEVTDRPSSGADEPPAGEADYGEVELRVFNPVTQNEFQLVAQQTMLDSRSSSVAASGRALWLLRHRPTVGATGLTPASSARRLPCGRGAPSRSSATAMWTSPAAPAR